MYVIREKFHGTCLCQDWVPVAKFISGAETRGSMTREFMNE